MINAVCRALLSILFCILGSHFARSSPQFTLAESHSALSISGGTLTVVLANKNGFVIASDSRQTWQDGHFDDNSQKLFRLSPKAAMAVAGFASNAREPFATDLASELMKALPSYTGEKGDSWAQSLFSSRLRLLRAISAAEGRSPTQLNTYVTIAEIGTDNLPLITTLRFDARDPNVTPKISTLNGREFRLVTFGVPDIVDAVQAGTYNGNSGVLKAFQALLKRPSRNRLAVRDMEKVASALIQETARICPEVGLPVQIGVFPTRKSPVWKQPVSSQAGPVLGVFTFLEYQLGINGFGPAIIGEYLVVTDHSTYNRTRVVLDGNVFIGNLFSECVLETIDRSPLYWRGNYCYLTYWRRPLHRDLPLDDHCQPIPHFGVQP